MKHEDLTHKIIGCAMKVHQKLGCGFQEVIYQRALAIELQIAQIDFEREKEVEIFYEDKKIGTRRVDFLIDEKILVEIKALSGLDDLHLAQGKNYLEAFQIDVGLLLNFGARSLQFKRLFL